MAVAVAGLVPVSAGLAGVILGSSMMRDGHIPTDAGADGHFRYLSGLLLGIGLGFWSTLSAIEHRTARFRLLAAIVVIGGLGRLIGMAVTGQPGNLSLAALAMELVVTPLLCLWQARVAQATTATRSSATMRAQPARP